MAETTESTKDDSFEFATLPSREPDTPKEISNVARQSFEFPPAPPPRSETPTLEKTLEKTADVETKESEREGADQRAATPDTDTESVMSLNADDDQNGSLPESSSTLKSAAAQPEETKPATTKIQVTDAHRESIRQIRMVKARLHAFGIKHHFEVTSAMADRFILNYVNEIAPGNRTEVKNFNEFIFGLRVFELVVRDVEKKLDVIEARLTGVQEVKSRYDMKYEEIMKTATTEKERRKRSNLVHEKLLKKIRVDISISIREVETSISPWIITGPRIFKVGYDQLAGIFSEYLMPPDYNFIMEDARAAADRLEVVKDYLSSHKDL
jgi:hypothetical protein